jgi:hypothetical protein
MSINFSILLQKATDFGEKSEEDLKITVEWVTRWKVRHGIVFKKLHVGIQVCDDSAAVNWLHRDWKTVLNKCLKTRGYL